MSIGETIARTPEPPYYAVIFTSTRTPGDYGYSTTADRMLELAVQQPGYLGFESAHEGLGITISYWENEDAIAAWKAQAEHLMAQQSGREAWYASYAVRVCKVERAYNFEKV
jgi:heme-degrading monooxygenase HmoA